jgi:hypothetical protein
MTKMDWEDFSYHFAVSQQRSNAQEDYDSRLRTGSRATSNRLITSHSGFRRRRGTKPARSSEDLPLPEAPEMTSTGDRSGPRRSVSKGTVLGKISHQYARARARVMGFCRNTQRATNSVA